MNWVDLAIVGVAIISGLLGLMRGFVRESLGVGAWAGAAYVAVLTAPLVRDKFSEWLGSPELGTPVAYTAMFIATLIILSMIAGWVGSLVHAVGLGAVDRSLGALFGAARGFVVVVAIYLLAGFAMPAGKWPDAVRTARLLPYVSETATWIAAQMPQAYRPSLPNMGAVPTAPLLPQLLQATPAGRARP